MTNEKTGFFESLAGNNSSARLIASFCILVAVAFSSILISQEGATVAEKAAAIGIIWTTIATPVLVYLNANKKAEIAHEEVKQETEALITKMPDIKPI